MAPTYSTIPTKPDADEESLLVDASKDTKPRLRLGAAVVMAFALGATVAYVAPSKSTTSASLASNPDCVGSSCSPLGVAKAWKQFQGGDYANDCVNSMAIALGEGIVPGAPLTYVDRPGGMPFEEFLVNTDLFDLNQEPWDGQSTLGPWQTMTDRSQMVTNIDDRIREAIGYVQSCCMGDVDVLLPPWLTTVPDYWCVWNNGNCENEVNGECRNPYESDDDRSPAPGTFPVSTILKSNLSPALTWCGCTAAGSATVGYSGRCSYNNGNHYTQYTDLATRICNRA